MRIGFGFDVHQLVEHVPFTLGGMVIPHHKGAIGHSDADTLIHAICDALLGAANLGDIGMHFPDSDPTLKGIDSKILLQKVTQLIAQRGYRIVNIDTTICLQQPKLRPYILQMQETLTRVMDIPVNNLSIKATTTEKLGFTGREEGVSAYAVALINEV
ncbi:MAG: 2-C-methyl-D-erythritol 2,4-cyclodiphosphate synthase [Dysgonamonadaceae bacterium]|jgi:2-C-methyl-D-erythritol 2,4-cyclodiphosphate synthase|nr:2-C-methyl-D-erythritol 2,4-cyclodiphosphate synthase [Dysgonamonadaceae bacterium]